MNALQRSGSLSPWLRFIARRFIGFVLGAMLLVIASFSMIHLVPGDPVRASLGLDVQPQIIAMKRHQLGLDQPLPTQFADYVSGVLHLNFGYSIKTDEPVAQVLAERLPATVELALVAILMVLLISIPSGLVAGARTHRNEHPLRELGFTAAASTLTAIPPYLMAVVLIVVFSLELKALPSAGNDGLSSVLLPALSLALGPAAYVARVVRIETVNVLGREYMMTARSKRLPARVIYLRHAMPNILTPALTLMGVIFGGLVAGSVVIENIFAWPGIGQTVVAAILDNDYPLVQTSILALGMLVLVVNTGVDAILVLVNPRLVTLRES